MFLFFDTETTGLPQRWNAPVTDVDNWPRLVQLAWIMCDDKGNVIEERSDIIKPEGFSIPVEASRVHGITTIKAQEEGQDFICRWSRTRRYREPRRDQARSQESRLAARPTGRYGRRGKCDKPRDRYCE